MSYQSYRKVIVFSISLFIPIFIVDVYREDLHSLCTPICFTINYFIVRILAIFIVFFSVYAHMAGVRQVHNLDRPSAFIILGSIFVLLLIGPPFAGYFFIQDRDDESHQEEMLIEMRKKALDIYGLSTARLFYARKYYVETGEGIPYVTDHNMVLQYVPDQKALKLRAEIIEYHVLMESLQRAARFNVIVLSGIILVSVITFIAFVRFKLRRTL